MKSIKPKIDKLKERIKLLGYFFVDTWGLIRSVYLVCFQTVKKPGIFFGYYHYFFASKFAEKRSRKWKSHWDQMGKKQGTFPFDDTKLIVCSQMELKMIKKRGGLDKKAKPRKMIKKSYYSTKN
jgi:hypothetical protein